MLERPGTGWNWETVGQCLIQILCPFQVWCLSCFHLTKSLPYPSVSEQVWVSKSSVPQSLFWFSALYSRDWCFAVNLDPCLLRDWRSAYERSPLWLISSTYCQIFQITNFSPSWIISRQLGVELPLISCLALYSNCCSGISHTCTASHSWFMCFW